MADPGFPVGGGVDLVRGAVDPRGGYVSKILHVKTKESGPVGGGAPGAPPRSANALISLMEHDVHSLARGFFWGWGGRYNDSPQQISESVPVLIYQKLADIFIRNDRQIYI